MQDTVIQMDTWSPSVNQTSVTTIFFHKISFFFPQSYHCYFLIVYFISFFSYDVLLCSFVSKIFLLSFFVCLQAVGLFFLTFCLICLFISDNEVSWVLILGKYFSVSLLKAKEVKEYDILFWPLVGFFHIPCWLTWKKHVYSSWEFKLVLKQKTVAYDYF